MSGVFQNIDPPSPSPPSECVPPPLVWGVDTLAGWRGGWGVNILEDARYSSVLYSCQYFVTIPHSFLSCTDGRLEHSLTYRTVTTAAATAIATNATIAKQDCYVNTVNFCEVPRDQSLLHSSTASPTTTTTVFTENRCSLLDQCEVRCCLQSREVGKSSGDKHSCCPSRTAHCRHCDLVVMTSPLARPVSQPRTNQVKTSWREQAQQLQRHYSGGQEANYRPSSSSRVPERKWSIIASANSEQSAKCVLNKSYVRPSYYSGKQLVHYVTYYFWRKYLFLKLCQSSSGYSSLLEVVGQLIANPLNFNSQIRIQRTQRILIST